jgi:hypothetical protein
MNDAYEREMENQCGCMDDGYDEPEVEAVPTMTFGEWLRSNPVIPNAEDVARKRLNLAPRVRS